MALQLDSYDLCRCFINDNTNWLPDSEREYVLGLVRSRNLAKLAGLSSDPRININCARSCRFYLQVEAFFKKCDAYVDESVCRPAAIASFERGERICRITNRRLDHYYLQPGRLDPDLAVLIDRSVSFIQDVLGDFTCFMDSIPELVKITGGATASLPRKRSQPAKKLMRKIDCAPGSVPYLRALTNHYGLNGLVKWDITPRNRVEFVAKNWKTERTIACEPTGSLPFQLAFDSFVKRRLRQRGGVDLSDQSGNQRHAEIGSVEDSWSTIDLSMASDTVAYNTVAWLLPKPWFEYLCAHRSSRFADPATGTDRKYAKFSSMGNGATFGLETLIFLSFVRAAGCPKGLVYGDDITITQDKVPALLKLLRFFGFVPNLEKSFTSGPFRESCGVHFWEGTNVTPFYVRTTAVWNKPALAHNVNGLALTAEHGCVWDYLVRLTRENGLLTTPYSLDSMAGVHLHPFHSYQQKLLRRTRTKGAVCMGGSLSAKTYRLKDKSVALKGVQPLLLWHIRKSTGRATGEQTCRPLTINPCLFEDFGRLWDEQGSSTSSYTISTDKYAVRWTVWHMPHKGIPEGLFGFSEHLSAIISS